MVALVDCNNFYASCERLFRPELNGKPVVVLSNNDGCIIARSNEAKDVGFKMGDVFHKVQDRIKEHRVHVFSSNYALYGDISARVMTNLARFSPNVEVYSIDECFLDMSGITHLHKYSHIIRNTVMQNTGIPVSVGVAPSKTLAKLANRMCKKTGGVCVLETEREITLALQDFEVGDLWGIGRKYAKKLNGFGVFTALDLRNLPLDFVKEKLTIQGVRMWYELHGKSCIPLKLKIERKKNICCSRGFGKATDDYKQLEEATASYVSRLSQKLRKDGSCATVLTVRLLTNPFKEGAPQAFPCVSISLQHPVNNVPDMVKAALKGLRHVYREGYMWSKVEVMATGLVPEGETQLHLFSKWNGKVNNKVSKLMDRINRHYGEGTLRMAIEGKQHRWAMRRAFLSKEYTTKWADIVSVK